MINIDGIIVFLVVFIEIILKNIEVSQLDSFTIENRIIWSGSKCWYDYVVEHGLCELFSIGLFDRLVFVRLMMWNKLESVKDWGYCGSLMLILEYVYWFVNSYY